MSRDLPEEWSRGADLNRRPDDFSTDIMLLDSRALFLTVPCDLAWYLAGFVQKLFTNQFQIAAGFHEASFTSRLTRFIEATVGDRLVGTRPGVAPPLRGLTRYFRVARLSGAICQPGAITSVLPVNRALGNASPKFLLTQDSSYPIVF